MRGIVKSTPLSEIGEMVERRLSHGDTLMGARLILGTVDDEPGTPATGGGDTQLISGTVDTLVSGHRIGPSYHDPVGIPKGAGNSGILPAGGGDTQIITGVVEPPYTVEPVGPTLAIWPGSSGPVPAPGGDPVPATGGYGAELGAGDPLSAFTGTTGATGFHDMRVISEPVRTSVLTGTHSAVIDAAYAGAIGIGSSAAGESQLHQLVTAIAGFGAENTSPVSSSIAQTEVEGARAMLAVSMHY